MIAYILVVWVGSAFLSVPGIASKASCEGLYEELRAVGIYQQGQPPHACLAYRKALPKTAINRA